MADVPDKEVQADRPPELPKELPTSGPSSRVTVTLVSLAALAIVGAATANSLPNHEYFSLPKFDSFALPKLDAFVMPKLDRIALPKFDGFSWPTFKHTASKRPAAPPPVQTVSVPIPDPIVRAILRDVQTTQDQHSASLASLAQSAENQQADLRKISRQLNTLTTQVSALHGAVGPLTTGSIPPTNSRARLLRPSRKTALAPPEISPVAATPALPKPVGPVSVGGAPLGSGA